VRRAPAEERRVGLDELCADLLLVLEGLDALPLLLLQVRRGLLGHHLALALDLCEARVVDRALLHHLLLAHLAHELALLLLLLVAHVLFRVHAPDGLLLLLVEALLGRQLTPLEHLLQLKLPLALLVRERERRGERGGRAVGVGGAWVVGVSGG